jgi:hypothetical protein
VNNTVKKGRIDAENSKLFAQIDGFVNENQPDTSIGYPKGYGYQIDCKSNGLRGFSSRDTDRTVPKKRNRYADR